MTIQKQKTVGGPDVGGSQDTGSSVEAQSAAQKAKDALSKAEERETELAVAAKRVQKEKFTYEYDCCGVRYKVYADGRKEYAD